jgi:predicted transcriptional regulator
MATYPYIQRFSKNLGERLRHWRWKRRASRRVLGDYAGVNHSVIGRAERGGDARLSTWLKLFDALGCELTIGIAEQEGAADAEDDLVQETDRRQQKCAEGLCANGKRRFF